MMSGLINVEFWTSREARSCDLSAKRLQPSIGSISQQAVCSSWTLDRCVFSEANSIRTTKTGEDET